MSRQPPHSDVRIRTYLIAGGGMRITVRGTRSGHTEEATTLTRNTLIVFFTILRLWLKGAKHVAAREMAAMSERTESSTPMDPDTQNPVPPSPTHG